MPPVPSAAPRQAPRGRRRGGGVPQAPSGADPAAPGVGRRHECFNASVTRPVSGPPPGLTSCHQAAFGDSPASDVGVRTFPEGRGSRRDGCCLPGGPGPRLGTCVPPGAEPHPARPVLAASLHPRLHIPVCFGDTTRTPGSWTPVFHSNGPSENKILLYFRCHLTADNFLTGLVTPLFS